VLLCVSANHRTTSFEILEKLSITFPAVVAVVVERSAVIDGAVVVATCNRFEAYLDVQDAPPVVGNISGNISGNNTADNTADNTALAIRALGDQLASQSGLTTEELAAALTIVRGEDVAHHLFAVSSGLDSIVVGEDEIAGQVRHALDVARRDGTTSSELEKLFQKATQTSRSVKAQTGLGGAGRSLVRLAIELASSRIADWSSTRVLLVGTGQYAATTVRALRDRGVSDITVFSPSGRAAPFSLKYALTPATDLRTAIGAADVVITCTINAVVAANHIPPSDRLLLIDLGLPRNIDPMAADVAGVELIDLEILRVHAPLAEFSASTDARELVAIAADEFTAVAKVEPAVIALRRHVFDLLDSEINRARDKGDDGVVEAALRHFAGVMLHGPSVNARQLAIDGRADEFLAGLDAVWGIRVLPVPVAGFAGKAQSA
jgi:glutamyl-tRNA reductase